MLIKWHSLYTILKNKTFSMMWENHAMVETESRKKTVLLQLQWQNEAITFQYWKI